MLLTMSLAIQVCQLKT